MKKHSNGKITILKYILLSETLESSFLIKYKKNTNDSNNVFYFYELKYPTNPIIDSNIIKLDSKNLSDVINSLNIYKSDFDLLLKCMSNLLLKYILTYCLNVCELNVHILIEQVN